MNTRALLYLSSLSSVIVVTSLLGACGTDDGDDLMTRHQVCERLSAASCERMAVCEPTVAPAGCHAKAMARCCPDGVCAEPVSADADRLAACEASVSAMSCRELLDGDLPASCRDLTTPIQPDGPPPPDGGPSDTAETGVLEVNWQIYAGGTSLTCAEFLGTHSIRIIATTPLAESITRDFTCAQGSALTTLPLGPYSIIAQARTASGQVTQQTPASTVVIHETGTTSTFTFQVTTSLGQHCSSLATVVCNACEPASTNCKSELYYECCSAAGLCQRPALAHAQAFPACLDAYATGAYCASSPPVCAGSITYW